MIYDDQLYLNSFDKNVVDEYLIAKRNPHIMKLFLVGRNPHFISEWINEYGRLNPGYNKSSFDHVNIKLASFWSKNSGSMNYKLPSCSPNDIENFIRRHHALDIVSETGESIRNMSRMEICKHQFFSIEQKYKNSFSTYPEYNVDKQNIMKKAISHFKKTMVRIIVNKVLKLKSAKQVQGFCSVLNIYCKNKVVIKALKKMTVSFGIKKKTYNSNDVLRMFYIDSQDNKNGHSFKVFKKNLYTKVSNTIAREIQAWFGTLWKQLKKYYKKNDENIAKEKIFIATSLNNIFQENHPDLYHDFYSICHTSLNKREIMSSINKQDIGSSISSRIENYVERIQIASKKQQKLDLKEKEKRKRKKKKKNVRLNLFSSIGSNSIIGTHNMKCYNCNEEKCEREKLGQSKGHLLQYKNGSNNCPESLYNQKRQNDTIFNEGILKFEKKIALIKVTSKNKKIHNVIIGRCMQKFDRNKHFITKSGLKIQGEMKTKDNTTYQYFKNSNKIIVGNETIHVLEYINPKIPQILFLLEVQQK